MNALPPDETELTSTERLRARVAARSDARHGIGADAGPRRRSVLPWVLTAALASFLLGIIANPWFEAEVRSRLPAFARDAPVAIGPQLSALAARTAALEARPAATIPGARLDAGEGERLARLEGQIAALDSAAAANTRRLDALAGGVATATARVEAATDESESLIAAARASAGQARGIVLVTAARRALDGGRPLGALAPALSAQFGGSPEVAAVIALGAAPITPGQLTSELVRLGPGLTGNVAGPARGNWFDILAARLMSAVRPAPAAAGSAGAEALVRAARAALARGDVEAAVARIDALPEAGRIVARPWRSAANRWLAGQRGLEALEAGLMAQLGLPPVPAPTSNVPVPASALPNDRAARPLA